METVLRKIDVKERLPEKHGMYNVVISTDQLPHTSSFNERGWMLRNVTHWYEEIELSSLGGEEKTLDICKRCIDKQTSGTLLMCGYKTEGEACSHCATYYLINGDIETGIEIMNDHYHPYIKISNQKFRLNGWKEERDANYMLLTFNDMFVEYFSKPKLAVPSKKGEPNTEEDCTHDNTHFQNIRCNVCHDCGMIIETDV